MATSSSVADIGGGTTEPLEIGFEPLGGPEACPGVSDGGGRLNFEVEQCTHHTTDTENKRG